MTSSSNISFDFVFRCCVKPLAFLVSLADKQPYRLQKNLVIVLF